MFSPHKLHVDVDRLSGCKGSVQVEDEELPVVVVAHPSQADGGGGASGHGHGLLVYDDVQGVHHNALHQPEWKDEQNVSA